MDEVARYSRTIMNGIEKRPLMYGDALSVELQYLMSLEFLAISLGSTPAAAREAYFKALSRTLKSSKMPAAARGLPVDDIIPILKHARSLIDPERAEAQKPR